MILPTWLVELITKIDQSDEFVCNHTETQCQLATKENELSMADAEIERLREENQLLKLERDELVRHEERMHADIGAILGSDTSLVDAAARAVDEIERLQKDRSRAENELDRLREWVAAVEDGYDKQAAEIASLNQQLDAAVALLRRPERVTWGYDSDHRVLSYFLDGNYAGDTLRDVILAEATEGIKS